MLTGATSDGTRFVKRAVEGDRSSDKVIGYRRLWPSRRPRMAFGKKVGAMVAVMLQSEGLRPRPEISLQQRLILGSDLKVDTLSPNRVKRVGPK